MRTLTYFFLVAFSTLFSQVQEYGEYLEMIDDYVSSERFTAGITNHVFLLTNKENKKFIFKIFSSQSLENIKTTCDILTILYNNNLKVPKQVIPPTQVGDQVIAIFEFIEGTHIEDSDMEKAAQIMARFHQIPIEKIAGPHKQNIEELLEKCKNWKYYGELKAIYESLDLSYLKDLPKGTIHGDFSYTNLIRDPEGNLNIIDFDLTRYDYFLTDLVRCHIFYSFDRKGKFKKDVLDRFITAYNQQRPLQAAELNNFYTHMKLCILKEALQMYIHLYVTKDFSILRLFEDPNNYCANPNFLARLILFLKDKQGYCIIEEDKL